MGTKGDKRVEAALEGGGGVADLDKYEDAERLPGESPFLTGGDVRKWMCFRPLGLKGPGSPVHVVEGI